MPDNIVPYVKKRYCQFKVSGSSRNFYKLNITADRKSGLSKRIEVKTAKSGWHIEGRGINVNLTGNGVDGKIFPDVHIVDSLLRIIYSYLLVKNNGLLMHAAGYAGNVYTGPAGTGKTTSVRGKKNILGDDIISLRKSDGTWYIYSTPFTGEFEGMVNSRREQLQSFYILSSLKANIKSPELMRKIFRNVVYFFSDKQGLNKLMEYCEDLAYRFHGYGYKNKHEHNN